MLGKNPKRPPALGDGSVLEVKEIFATFQGEGPYAGTPAVFIRLAGCNLACAFCDTDFENGVAMSASDVLRRTLHLAGDKRRLAVITGGEPFRQPIGKLCRQLIGEGFRVQIETNGTLYREIPAEAEAVCSPKHAGGTYIKPHPQLRPHIKAFKFLISAEDQTYGYVPAFIVDYPETPVYIQPIDVQDKPRNLRNQKRALEIAEAGGHRISLQLHKILEIA